MKNKNIKDTFESFSPTKEQKEKIYESIVNRQKSKDKWIRPHFKAKLAYSLLACFIVAAITALLLNSPKDNNSMSLLESDNTPYDQANTQSENSNLPVATDKKAVFNGFVLMAYAAKSKAAYYSANYTEEAEKLILKPDVKVLLGKYTPAMSNVPGLPFTVGITGNDYVEAINVSVDSGELNKWNTDTGIVHSEGQSATIDIGETIYWSPNYNGDTANIKNITIIVEAVTGDTVIGRQKINIIQDESGYYYANVEELELL